MPRIPASAHVAIVGHVSPDDTPGHDLTYAAAHGLLAPPLLPRTLVADLGGAERAVSTALALLLARERTGEAARAEVALADAAAAFSAPLRHGLTAGGGVLGGGYPLYGLYRARDGWVALAALEPHFRERLLAELGLDDAEHETLAACSPSGRPPSGPRGRASATCRSLSSRSRQSVKNGRLARGALDDHGRVVDGPRELHVGLPHADSDPREREAAQKRVGERARERLEQVVRAGLGDLDDGGDDVAVVDRVLDPVGLGRRRLRELEVEVDEESLALLPLVLEHAVEAAELDAVELDRHRSTLPRSTAAATASASTCARTSCTRKSVAPRSKAATAAPTEAASDATGRRLAHGPGERRLPREPHQHGASQRDDPVEPADELEILVGGLAEADPGVEPDALLVDARGHGRAEALVEERRDLVDDVLVPGRVLHRRRVALHVHQADVDTRVGDDARELRVASECRDVVHHRRAERDRPAGNFGARGVDRDREAGEELEHRHDPPQLLRLAHGLCSGACRLAADVDERRAFGEHPPAGFAASSGEAYDPPSEKLSGVTLTIPITAGRGQRSSFAGRLIVHGR